MSDAEVVHSRAMSRSGLRLGDLGQTHHCLGPNNRQRNRPAVGGTQRRAMRVRAARPRRNVQQCEQELLHSAAPILTNTLHGLNPKMLPNPSIVPGRELRGC